MRTIPASELIINDDGSIFHLHLLPEQLADTVILVGDPGRVALVAEHFDTKECEVANREFKTVTGTYKGKRMTVLSTGISIGNIGINHNREQGEGALKIVFYNKESMEQAWAQLKKYNYELIPKH